MLKEAPAKIHFIGIGGYGMSALALILLQKGYFVSGSDLKSSALTDQLIAGGAVVSFEHRAANIKKPDLVVYSTAISEINPELQEVRQKKIPLWHRSELLAALLNSSFGIAIAGAHGKTTTTALTALLLEKGGLDPTAIVGGVVPAYKSNARLGKSKYLVAEADESDSSFTRYYPAVALVTGIEADHLEHYGFDYARLKEAYGDFLSHLTEDGLAVICAEDESLVELCKDLSCQVVTYAAEGFGAFNAKNIYPPDYLAKNIVVRGRKAWFDLYSKDILLAGQVELNVPGRHNVLNATGALAIAHQMGLDPVMAKEALKGFSGVGRRFDLIGEAKGVKVLDDYAHHPTEIAATVEAAKAALQSGFGAAAAGERSGNIGAVSASSLEEDACQGRLIVIFQPHRYSRTASFFDEFATAFKGVDQLFLHSIYSAGEAPVEGAGAEQLAQAISFKSKIAVYYSPKISELEEQAALIASPGDLVFTMGAGDITRSAPRILTLLENREGR